MNKEQISAAFDAFFEFPTSDKSQVSSVSCKLFAKVIADMALAKQAIQLVEAQKDADRYSWAVSNPLYFMQLCNGFQVLDDAIDECIQEGKA